MNYEGLIVENELVADNALLMLLTLLTKVNVKKVYLVGFDGYEIDLNKNYANPDLKLAMTKQQLQILNNEIYTELNKIEKQLNIKFLTNSIYEYS